MQEFVKALMSPQDDPLTCSACQDALAEYIDAQLMRVTPTGEHLAVEQHLQRCPYCADSYRELLELTTLAYADDLPDPAAIPRFDFAALTGAAAGAPERPYWWDEFGRLILRFSADLLAAWQPPTLAPAYRGLKRGEEIPLYEFHLEEAERDLVATITVQASGPTGCTVEVAVDVPSRGGWPNLADIAVTLRRGNELLAQSFTDAFGKVQFPNIAQSDLVHLVVEVAPHE